MSIFVFVYLILSDNVIVNCALHVENNVEFGGVCLLYALLIR